MNKKTFKTLMKLFDLETIEILGDARFAASLPYGQHVGGYFTGDYPTGQLEDIEAWPTS